MAIRPLPDQQPLRIPVLSRLGLHPHPAAGGTGLAFSHRGGCGHPHGPWLHCLRQLCLARSIAVSGSSGSRPALKLVGHACERDHGELRRTAGGIPALLGGVGHRSRPIPGTAEQFHRQWWISSGGLDREWWFCSAAIGSAEHQRATRQPQLSHDHGWVLDAYGGHREWCCLGE